MSVKPRNLNIFKKYKDYFEEQKDYVKDPATLSKVNHEVLSYLFYIEEYDLIKALYENMKVHRIPKEFLILFALDALGVKKDDGMEYTFDVLDFLEAEFGIGFDAIKAACLRDEGKFYEVFKTEPAALALLSDYVIKRNMGTTAEAILESAGDTKMQLLETLSAELQELCGLKFPSDLIAQSIAPVRLERAI